MKAERSAHRLIGKSRFTLLDDISALADALFAANTDQSGSALPREQQFALLRRHLLEQPEPEEGGWFSQVRAGVFSRIPDELDPDSSLKLAHLIDGYSLARELGAADPFKYADDRLAQARATGRWSGGPAELWASLFLEYRRWRMAPIDPPDSAEQLIEELGRQLRQALS